MKFAIGIMSGTSADGIDAALVSIEGHGLGTKISLVDSLSLDYEKDFKSRLIAVAGGGSTTTCELSALNFLLGELFADAAETLWKRNEGICPRIDFVASHGHTFWHEPRGLDYFGRNVRSTLQLGEFSCISERLGCPVVGDFRVRDVSAGGQGAPLVPFTEYILYANEEKNIALQNIGGIGNISMMKKACGCEDVIAYDTGPGNMVIDALVKRYTNGGLSYDDGGAIALGARIDDKLLSWMVSTDTYIPLPSPKTTGRELYGPNYVERIVEKAAEMKVSMPDLIATATAFTAVCIELALTNEGFVPDELVVNGGGSHNKAIIDHLQRSLPKTKVVVGKDSDMKEAIAFVILANERLHGSRNEVLSVTGARHYTSMGKVSI